MDSRTLPAEAAIRRVVDGDTVELEDSRLVRYLGIDAPEVRRRDGAAWRYDPAPYAEAATEANRRLVEGRRVRLEYDVQTHDRYGRLLAYVFVEDRMVNEQLVADGYAQVLTIPPNVRHAERLRQAAARARAAGRGLWRDD